MTVQELIARLQDMDPDLLVLVDWGQTGVFCQDLVSENLRTGELTSQGNRKGRAVLVIGQADRRAFVGLLETQEDTAS